MCQQRRKTTHPTSKVVSMPGSSVLRAAIAGKSCDDSYNDGMQRTTIMVPADLLEQLRRIAAERGTSVATLVREALEEKVRQRRPRPRSLGIGASGSGDTARRTADERPVPRDWR